MNKGRKNKKNNNVKEKQVENVTIYGEFIPTFFSWNTLKEQKEKAEEMENMTKRK